METSQPPPQLGMEAIFNRKKMSPGVGKWTFLTMSCFSNFFIKTEHIKFHCPINHDKVSNYLKLGKNLLKTHENVWPQNYQGNVRQVFKLFASFGSHSFKSLQQILIKIQRDKLIYEGCYFLCIKNAKNCWYCVIHQNGPLDPLNLLLEFRNVFLDCDKRSPSLCRTLNAPSERWFCRECNEPYSYQLWENYVSLKVIEMFVYDYFVLGLKIIQCSWLTLGSRVTGPPGWKLLDQSHWSRLFVQKVDNNIHWINHYPLVKSLSTE